MNTQQSNVNTPSLQGAMASAIMSANDKQQAAAKATDKPAAMHTIIVRNDVQNKPVVFFPDTYDKANNSITYWNGEKNSAKITTSADYYTTSKPAEEDAVKDLAAKYSAKFGAKELLIRKRLFKTGVLERDSEGQATTVDVDDYKKRLLAAVTKAIMETL